MQVFSIEHDFFIIEDRQFRDGLAQELKHSNNYLLEL
jgi:hypothetical protein